MCYHWCIGLACLVTLVDAARFADSHRAESVPERKRLEFIRSWLHAERQVIEQFAPRASELQELATGSAKVAFLFLIRKDFPWADVWDAFFEDAIKGTYSIYIHRAALKGDAERKAYELPLSKYGAIDVPWVKTSWCALFGAEVASLFTAMQDANNVQFVFVSDSSVPLKPYRYVYNELARNSPQTSKLCLASPAFFKDASTELANQEATRSCCYRDFFRAVNPRAVKHHQWAVFNRPHAKLIVQYAREAVNVFEDVWFQAAPDHQVEGCTDEAVPLMALLHALQVENRSTGNTWTDLSRLGVEQNCLTFVQWRNCFVGSELESSFREYDFPHAFPTINDSYLKTLVAQNFMFARKFPGGAQVVGNSTQPLTRRLPQLWSQLNWQKAQMSQWSRLETSGKPGPLRSPDRMVMVVMDRT